jgi:hypothetical protein
VSCPTVLAKTVPETFATAGPGSVKGPSRVRMLLALSTVSVASVAAEESACLTDAIGGLSDEVNPGQLPTQKGLDWL